MFAVANTKSHAIRYHLPCLVSQKMRILVLYVQNTAVIETAFNQYLEMKAPLMMNHLRLKGVDRLNTTPVFS